MADAFQVLAESDFDVVVLDPLIAGGASDFLNALKEGAVEHQRTVVTLYGPREGSTFLRGVRPPPLEILERARSRHASTPFIVTPLEHEAFYVIVVRPPDATAVHDVKKVPLSSSILSVTAAALLGKSSALA